MGLLEREKLACCLGRAGSTHFLEHFKPLLEHFKPLLQPQCLSPAVAPPFPLLCFLSDLSDSEYSQRKGGSGKQASFLLGPELLLLAMPWTLQPKWLAGKGLPLLGAILLRKTEKSEAHWKHRQVMYSSHLGKADWSPGRWRAPRED